LSKTHFATVVLDDATVGQCRFEPGWRWSADVASLMDATSCPIRHLGYSMSRSVRVSMDDGRTLDIGPDTVFDVPPGHDKWVLGDEPWETIEWGGSGRAFGAAIQDPGNNLATVLFTEIVDSTAKLRELDDRAWHRQRSDWRSWGAFVGDEDLAETLREIDHRFTIPSQGLRQPLKCRGIARADEPVALRGLEDPARCKVGQMHGVTKSMYPLEYE
jgi:hypothetical protein